MKVYKLYTNPAELRKLNKDIWTEEYIKARLIDKEKIYEVLLSFRGHQIRKHQKKSYNILFINPWHKEGVHEIHLNAEYKDPSLIRNRLSMEFFNHIDVLAPKTEHVLLYMNGVFKGIYLQLESMDQDSLKKRGLPSGPIFYATDDDANFSLLTAEENPKPTLLAGYTRKSGTDEDEAFLIDLMICINTFTNEEFNKKIAELIDVEGYLRWLAGVVCTQNFDGFVHNYALYRNSETGLFQISPWDYDGTWGRDIHGEKLSLDYVPIQGYNTLTARILNNPEYCQSYKTILTSILEHEFSVEYLSPIIEELFNHIRPYIGKDPFTKSHAEQFNDEYPFILQFIKNRKEYLLQHLPSLIR
jgi:spore coat protein H